MTVEQLSSDLNLDLDETLVTLWDAGFDGVEDVDSIIPAELVAKAHRALGVSTLREIRTIAYWERNLNLSHSQLRDRFAELSINLPVNARVLPKGSLNKLRKAGMLASLQLMQESIVEIEDDSMEGREPPEEYFEWRTVGSKEGCTLLTLAEVRKIHDALEDEFAHSPDPIIPPGVRDDGLLASAVYRTETSMDGIVKYPTAQMAAAAILHSLTHNHAFFNGNKRTAVVAMLVLLDRNGILLTCSEQELFRYVLRVAQHRVVNVPRTWSSLADRETIAISEWICVNSRPLTKGERAIKWRELRKILTRFGCVVGNPLPGNKIKVRRKIEKKGLFGRVRQQELIAHAWYGGDGREVAADHLHYLRQELRLDDASGYDSVHFYGTDHKEPDEFIAQYRNILKRLARL